MDVQGNFTKYLLQTILKQDRDKDILLKRVLRDQYECFPWYNKLVIQRLQQVNSMKLTWYKECVML